MSHRNISAHALKVSYGPVEVLSGATLEIPPSRRLALLGANGSGKTTLLRMLSGSARPDSGVVTVDGEPVAYTRAGLRQHRQVVQLVAQDPDDQLFAADVYRDVAFGPVNLGLPVDQVQQRVADVLGLLSIEELADRPIHQLSFGQRKRVAIAGALAMQPCVMLLDEPTAGLDPQGVAEMTDALERLLAADTTVVIATHDIDFALAWADSVAVLRDGRLLHGEPSSLLGDAELIAGARLRMPTVLGVLKGLGFSSVPGVRDVESLVTHLANQRVPGL